ncbi:signal peptidase I [Microbacterium sp. JZ37]|uniref:signal peptidase I n=1 Tax=Microbacterium sp. JZ37 TaxID=2654193 RepID=UPI002B48972A|nr:signal peptidase I [Microbacterium sp. JZ37]WRH16642.1 signal peptidase I [Microbacterium sp. JZ37]
MSAPPQTRRDARARRAQGIRRRTPARFLGDVLLTLAALAGTVCIVLVVLAYLFDITLIMFRTGSMAPTIPSGSVAVVQRVPAASLDVGDVVTVDREGQLPVTHRITSIDPGASADERVITMRGDANEQDDVAPYAITTARIVLFSVPGIAPLIASFGDPRVLGGLSIGAALLVGWAFWPRRADDTERAGEEPAPDGRGTG